jgi:hypothetical protein
MNESLEDPYITSELAYDDKTNSRYVCMYVCMYLMKLPSAFDCAMQVGAPGLDYRIYRYALNPADSDRIVPSAFKRPCGQLLLCLILC